MFEVIIGVIIILFVFLIALLLSYTFRYRKKKDPSDFIDSKITEKKLLDYSPDLNKKKYLLIISCHCNSDLKYTAIKEHLQFFNYESVDKVIINSKSLPDYDIPEICEANGIKYYKVDNDKKLDFAKWVYVLENEDISNYDYIIFSNDSYLIEAPVNHFLNAAVLKDVELYGYNSSTQNQYHYQSYLFILKRDSVDKLIEKVKNCQSEIKKQDDVVKNFELKMTQWFETKDCFLEITPYNDGKNIFFDNDRFYLQLKEKKLLPFVKIKRVLKNDK